MTSSLQLVRVLGHFYTIKIENIHLFVCNWKFYRDPELIVVVQILVWLRGKYQQMNNKIQSLISHFVNH